MTERGTGPRTQTHEIAIAAPVEAVWKAITDAEELTRWFVEAAKVEPGEGGSIWVSWGPGEDGTNRIEVWEPNRKLRLTKELSDMGLPKGDGQSPMLQEYTVERRDGKTVLRLVHSGIPNAPEWDGFYDGTNTGWPQFFRMMRHYLERHAGQPRSVIKVVGKLPGSLDEAWTRLTGPSGLGFDPVPGKEFSTRTGAGDAFTGEVVFAKSPNILELTLREYGDALLAHTMMGAGGSQYVYSVLSVYGKNAAEVDAIRGKWQGWLTTVLGVEPVTAGAAT